jgi:hypothetical protein
LTWPTRAQLLHIKGPFSQQTLKRALCAFLRVNVLKPIWQYLSYNAYDRHGKLKMLRGRTSDRHAFDALGAPASTLEAVLSGICDSFDIDESQRYQLRPTDNLGDIYRAMTKHRLGDDMEYERLYAEMKELIGEFDCRELSQGVDVTIGKLIEFVSRKLAAQQG